MQNFGLKPLVLGNSGAKFEFRAPCRKFAVVFRKIAKSFYAATTTPTSLDHAYLSAEQWTDRRTDTWNPMP